MQTTMYDPATMPKRSVSLGLSRRELERYSLAKAILASAGGRLAADAGFELEVSRAECKARGLVEPMGATSFYVPDQVLTRDLTTATAGNLVSTDVAPRGIVAETLRTMSVIGRLGIAIEPNMVGDVSIPAVTVAPVPTWLASDGVSTISAVQPTISTRVATPKTCAALTTCSHQLLTTAPALAERLAFAELGAAIATAADTAFLAGTGASGQPQGVVGANGVGTVTGTALDAAALVEFQTDILTANAVAGSISYVTTPAVAALLKSRPELLTAGTTPLWVGSLVDGIVGGCRAVATNSAPTATLIAGDFSTALMLLWPGLLLAADPYTGFRTGVVTLRAMLSLDFVLLRPAGFSCAESVT